MTEQIPQQPGQEQNPSTAVAQPQNSKKGGRIALLVILVIAALAAAATAVYFLMQSEDEPTVTEEAVYRAPLSEDRATISLDNAGMTPPDISKYAYVAQDDLIGPRFTDIKVQEPSNLDAPADVVVECTVTANAIFKNKGVEISVPVTLPFDYSMDSDNWVPGSLTQGESVSTPLSSAKASDIIEHLDEILYAYDPTYADEMAEADIVKTKADLTVDGGTISVDLSKTIETEDPDGKKYNQLRTCTVDLAVTWSNDAGWQVAVGTAGEIENSERVLVYSPPPAETDDNNPQEQTNTVEPSKVKPTNLGKVSSGDKVAFSGKLQKLANVSDLSKANNYNNKEASKNADGNVQMVLKLSQPITMTLDGQKYTFTYLPIAVSGIGDRWKELLGSKADVSGSFEDNFGTSWCPLGIKTLKIDVS